MWKIIIIFLRMKTGQNINIKILFLNMWHILKVCPNKMEINAFKNVRVLLTCGYNFIGNYFAVHSLQVYINYRQFVNLPTNG